MMFDPVTMYATRVLQGDIVAGPHVRDACARHFRDLDNPALMFDVDAMQYVFDFFEECLTLSDGQFDGRPFLLDDSQKFILGSLFGWKIRATGYRRFRRAYIEQGKGNGKSPFAGGVGLFGMIADGEKAAQIYSAASSRDQADILFQDAVRMVKATPGGNCDGAVQFTGNSKIYAMTAAGERQNGSIFKPLAKTAGVRGSGLRPHMALCDEIHEHPDGGVVDMLERGFKFRQQPLLLMITNSGTDRNSFCWEEHRHAVRVASGEIVDDSSFSYVCALDEGDDPLTDETCWIKANPLLGTILQMDYLRGVVAQAVAIPGRLNSILRLHFCQWTDAETAWIARSAWEAIEDPGMTIDDFADADCCGGLDLSSTKDLSAKALVFDDGVTVDPEDGTLLPKYAAFVHGYTPEATLHERSQADKAPYEEWVDGGFLTATPGPVIRFGHIIRDLTDDQNRFNVRAIGYDAHLIPRFKLDAEDAGADLPLVEHPQGWNKRNNDEATDEIGTMAPLWMPGSIDTLETLILEGRLRVHVNPALRSAVAAATFVESPAGLKRFAKQNAAQRIDFLIALTMAIGTATAHIEPSEQGTVHEIRGAELRRANGR